MSLITKDQKAITGEKARVDELEQEMLKMPQVPCPVIHRFGPGVYIREVTIPGGALAVGHHQNFEHQNIFLKGRVTMFHEDGTSTELKAPMIFTGKPGRKIGYAHEDMVWLNVYATDERDVEKLEAKLLTKSDNWKLNAAQEQNLKLLKSSVDNEDFLRVLFEMGLSPETVREQSENPDDMTVLPIGEYKIKIGQSNIEGRGLFATADIQPGELIAPARISGKRTIAGRFTNHSATPNAVMVRGKDDDIDLVSSRTIAGCHGGRDGEEITINYQDAVELNLQIMRSLTCRQ